MQKLLEWQDVGGPVFFSLMGMLDLFSMWLGCLVSVGSAMVVAAVLDPDFIGVLFPLFSHFFFPSWISPSDQVELDFTSLYVSG